MKPISKIAVIGFGAAGAAAAIELTRCGFAVDVYEQAKEIGPVGAGILLHPSGQLVLEQLGIHEAVCSPSEPVEVLDVHTSRGKQLLNIRYDELVPGRLAYGVLRSRLFEALAERARSLGVSLRLATSICDIIPTTAGHLLKDESGIEHGPYDLLLLCDGARSRVRSKAVSWSYTWKYRYGARWKLGACSRVQGKLHQVVAGSRHLIGILPTGGGTASFFWGTAPGEKRDNYQKWRTEVLHLCPEAEELLLPTEDFSDFIETSYAHVFLGRITASSVLLLGDAWHAMSPHLGQGTNLALLDGFVFAKELAFHQGDLERSKKAFYQQRIANNRVYQTLSFCFSPFFQSGGLIKGALRDFFLPPLSQLPWFRRHMVTSIGGMKSSLLTNREIAAFSD